MQKRALEILMKERLRNCNIINFMQQYSIDRVDIKGESVLVRGESDEIWNYISSENRDEFSALIENVQKTDQYFAVLEDWMLPFLINKRNIVWQLTSVKLILPQDTLLPASISVSTELRSDDAKYIYNHYGYQQYTTVEYITQRIQAGNALGIYEDNRLAAWIATHDDGAIGLLHVLEEYRRKGYGQDLIFALVVRLREQGKLPFLHIEENNEKSMNLALKTGFIRDRRIHWLRVSE